MVKVRKKLVKKVKPIKNEVQVEEKEKSHSAKYVRKEVLEILKTIKPGVASKDLVESMKYFFMSGTEIVAYNDRISIQHPFVTPFTAFIKADSFYNVMAKSTVETLALEKFGDGSVHVTAKGLNVSLPSVIDDEVVSRIRAIGASLNGAKWEKMPEKFAECVNLCSFAASKSESESTLSCVHIDEATCIASDNNRIAVADMGKPMQKMFIKASEIKNLVAVVPTEYAMTKAWLHFRNEAGCIFSIKRIEGEYPNFLPHFEFEGSRVDLPADITEGTDLASIFTSETEQPSIAISIEKNKCFLVVKTEGGSLDFSTAIVYTGKKLQFTINPDFLLEMMKHSTSIVLTDGKAKLETESFSLLTSLIEE